MYKKLWLKISKYLKTFSLSPKICRSYKIDFFLPAMVESFAKENNATLYIEKKQTIKTFLK